MVRVFGYSETAIKLNPDKSLRQNDEMNENDKLSFSYRDIKTEFIINYMLISVRFMIINPLRHFFDQKIKKKKRVLARNVMFSTKNKIFIWIKGKDQTFFNPLDFPVNKLKALTLVLNHYSIFLFSFRDSRRKVEKCIFYLWA